MKNCFINTWTNIYYYLGYLKALGRTYIEFAGHLIYNTVNIVFAFQYCTCLLSFIQSILKKLYGRNRQVATAGSTS